MAAKGGIPSVFCLRIAHEVCCHPAGQMHGLPASIPKEAYGWIEKGLEG